MKLERVTVNMLGPRPQGRDRQGEHHDRQLGKKKDIEAASPRSRPRSRDHFEYDREKLQERLQARRRRRGDPRRARPRSRSRRKKDRVEDALNATRARCSEASCRAAAWRCSRQEGGRPPHQRQCRRAGRHQHRAEGAGSPSARSRENAVSRARSWSARSWRTSPRRLASTPDRRVCRHGRQGIIDPARGCAPRCDASSVGAPGDPEAMVAETAEGAAPRCPAWRRMVNGGMGF